MRELGDPVNMAIFASGSGTNAENIIHFFKEDPKVKVRLIITNKKNAGVIERAERLSVPIEIIGTDQFKDKENMVTLLSMHDVDFIILAGFLLLIPEFLIDIFPDRIINIHPALLPKYGGKGMYGSFVHEAVISNNESESGITVHYVNSEYDEGKIIAQYKLPVDPSWDAERLQEEVHKLEYRHLPQVIKDTIKEQFPHV